MKRNTADCTLPLSAEDLRRPVDDSGTEAFHSFGLWTGHSQGCRWRLRQRSTLPGSPFPETTCANCYGMHPRFCRGRQASSNEYARCKAMSENHPISRTLNVSRSLLLWPCQVVALQLLNTANVSGDGSIPVLWQLRFLEKLSILIFIQNVFPVAYAIICYTSNLLSHLE